jgi:hypothetical protein
MGAPMSGGPLESGLLSGGPCERVPTPSHGTPLGGLPHKKRFFLEWESTCVGAPFGAGPFQLGSPGVQATLSAGSLEWGLP